VDDFNGDGFDDLILGAPGSDYGGPDAGEAYVVFGTDLETPFIDLSTLSGADGTKIRWLADSGYGGFETGRSVSGAGDVNGDGFADVIVGAPRSDQGGPDAGEAYVVFGTPLETPVIDLSTLSASDGFKISWLTGDHAGYDTGRSVSGAGDVNGDGFDDVIVGAPRSSQGGYYAGAAYVVFGKSGGFGTDIGGQQVIDLAMLTSEDGLTIRGGGPPGFFGSTGFSVSAAGDVNGDGFGDLMLGAPFLPGGAFVAGESYLIFGGDFTGSVLFAGTSGNDSLTGTPTAETFVGGSGDDLLTGNGGADAFQGGAGNDTMIVDGSMPLDLDGGSGIDTVNLDGLGASIDLSGGALDFSRFTNIEKIELGGVEANTLLLGKLGVLGMTGSNGDAFDDTTLLIKGDPGDAVQFVDSGWTLSGTVIDPFGETGTYDTLVLGGAKLYIQDTITIG
jgi:hypothetical protein